MATYSTYLRRGEYGSTTNKGKTLDCVFLYNSGLGSCECSTYWNFLNPIKINKKARCKIETNKKTSKPNWRIDNKPETRIILIDTT